MLKLPSSKILFQSILVALGVMVLFAGVSIADKLICIYGVWSLGVKVESKWSFIMALIIILPVPFLRLENIWKLSQSLSNYTFYFLIIGVVGFLSEYIEDVKHEKS